MFQTLWFCIHSPCSYARGVTVKSVSALVQVAAIISALVQFGCYHWCSSTVSALVQWAAITHRQVAIASGMLEVCMNHLVVDTC